MMICTKKDLTAQTIKSNLEISSTKFLFNCIKLFNINQVGFTYDK